MTHNKLPPTTWKTLLWRVSPELTSWGAITDAKLNICEHLGLRSAFCPSQYSSVLSHFFSPALWALHTRPSWHRQAKGTLESEEGTRGDWCTKILPRTHQQIPVSAGCLQGHGNLSIIKKCVSVIEFVVMGLYCPIWQQSTFQSPEKDEIEVLLTVNGASIRNPFASPDYQVIKSLILVTSVRNL